MIFILLAIFTVSGVYLRISGLSNYYFSPDDVWHILIAKSPLSQIYFVNNTDTDAPLIYYILHFLLLIFPNDYSIARLISVIPGILFIPAVYFLGKKIINSTAGLFMSFNTAFAIGTVLLSQSVRQYSLFLLISVGVYYTWENIRQNIRLRTQIVYSLFSLLAMATHYLFVVNQFFLYLTIMTRILTTRPLIKKNLFFWTLAQLPALTLLFLAYINQGKKMWFYDSPYHYGAVNQWMLYGFPDNFLDYSDRFITILHTFTHAHFDIFAMFFILFCCGIYTAIKRKKYAHLTIALAPFPLHLLFASLKLYPFVGARYYLHLYLPVIILTAMSVSNLKLFSLKNIYLIKVLLVLSISFLFIIAAKPYDNYRTNLYSSTMEFPVTYQQQDRFFNFLKQNLQENDLIISDRPAAFNYLLSDSSYKPQQTTSLIGHTTFYQTPVCFHNESLATFLSLRDINQILSDCPNHNYHRVVITSLGWDIATLINLGNDSFFRPLIQKRFYEQSYGGMALIYIVDYQDFIDYLKTHTPSPS